MEEPRISTAESPDWTIKDLYQKAWKIVKSNKILWIFAAAAGGGMSLSNNFRFDNEDSQFFQDLFKKQPTPDIDGIAKVLGNSTTAATDFSITLLSAVPLWLWLLLFAELILLVLISIVTSVIYKSWATGALLENIQSNINKGKTTISESSEKAFAFIKPLLWLQVIPGLLISLAAVIIIMFFVIGFGATTGLLKVIFGISTFLFVLAAIYAFIMLTLSLIWAPRQVVSEKKSGKEAVISSYYAVKKKFWPMFLLGVVNTIVSSLVFVITAITIAAVFAAGGFAAWKIEILRGPFIILGSILFIISLFAFTVGTAVLQAFKATVWSLAYYSIKGKYGKNK